jgi:hypothetical protein
MKAPSLLCENESGFKIIMGVASSIISFVLTLFKILPPLLLGSVTTLAVVAIITCRQHFLI